MLFHRQEVLALDVGDLLRACIRTDQLSLKDVLFVGLRQTVGERIDALTLIELLLRIKALIDRLHQGGGRLGGLGAQALLRLGGQLGTIFFCIPDLLLNGQEVLAPLGGQRLITGV